MTDFYCIECMIYFSKSRLSESFDILNECYISISWTFHWIYISSSWAYWSSFNTKAVQDFEYIKHQEQAFQRCY